MMKFEQLNQFNYILSKDGIGLKEFTPKEAVEGQPDKEHLFPHLWYQALSFQSSITAFDTFIRYTEREENLPHPTTLACLGCQRDLLRQLPLRLPPLPRCRPPSGRVDFAHCAEGGASTGRVMGMARAEALYRERLKLPILLKENEYTLSISLGMNRTHR